MVQYKITIDSELLHYLFLKEYVSSLSRPRDFATLFSFQVWNHSFCI